MTCDRLVVFSGFITNKTDRHDITEILLKVALNTINLNQTYRLTNDSGTNCLPHILHGFLTPTAKTKYITHNNNLYCVLYCQLNNTHIIVKWLTMHIIVSTLQSRYSQRFMTYIQVSKTRLRIYYCM